MSIADSPFLLTALLELEQSANDAGWDRPARLYALTAERVSDTELAVGGVEFPGFGIAVHMSNHSHSAVLAVTEALRRYPDEVRQDLSGLFGVVLVDEAWIVQHDVDQPMPVGPLAEHPDRVEHRFALFVAGDESSRILMRRRGGEPEWAEGDWDGRLTDAVRGLLSVALQV